MCHGALIKEIPLFPGAFRACSGGVGYLKSFPCLVPPTREPGGAGGSPSPSPYIPVGREAYSPSFPCLSSLPVKQEAGPCPSLSLLFLPESIDRSFPSFSPLIPPVRQEANRLSSFFPHSPCESGGKSFPNLLFPHTPS